MIAVAIILIVLVLLALLRFGVSAEYSADGVLLIARAGPFSIRVFPRKAKREDKKKDKRKEKKKAKKKAKKKEKKKKKKEQIEKELPEEKKGGGLKGLMEVAAAAKNTLGRLRRRLLIKRLTVHYIAANDDPSKTAMMFGKVNVVFGMVIPLLEKAFRIKRRDLRASADFNADKPTIYVRAAVSIAVWEVIYIAFAILPLIIKKSRVKTNRKGGKKDGESSDKRTHGNDNAKS